MSDIASNGDRMAYRRLLNSFSKKLGAEDVKSLSYIYGLGEQTSSERESTSLDLLRKLEHLAIFSFEDPRGLVQISMDVGYLDWASEFKEYAESRKKPVAVRNSLRRSELPSDVHRSLLEAHDSMVSKFLAFEDKFQGIWKCEKVTKEDGLKLLRKGKKLVQEMQLGLEKAEEKLNSVSYSAESLSSSSSSSSSSSIELSSSPDTNSSMSTAMQGKCERDRDTPMPKPRKPKPPPPYRPQKYTPPVQESTRHNSPMLQTSMNDTHQSHDLPPPIPPKTNSPTPPRKANGSRRLSPTSQMCYTASQTVVCVQKRLGGGGCAEVALEEAEQEAGDSGVESGSGSVQHTGIPMENPPPEPHSSGHQHAAINGEKMDEEQLYHEVTRI